MRNLKRALSLALASVMLLGMMVVGTGASYADVDSTKNVEAIEVMQAVGVMTGDDKGNFNPDQKVTRGEMAVVMANLLNLNVKDFIGAKTPFTDVPEWAVPYVAACYADGITAGISATQYGFNYEVTTAQAALMMMKALGYFQNAKDFGSDWQVATVKQGSKINLFDDITAGASTAMTRNEVAQIALNTLEATMVETDGNSTDITLPGDISISTGDTKYVDVTSKENYAKAFSDSAVDNNGTYAVQLGEKLFDGDLTKNSANDALGRPGYTWDYKNDEIGTYADEADDVVVINNDDTATISSVLTSSDYFNLKASNIASGVSYTLNGDTKTSGTALQAGDVVEIFKNDGKVTEVAVARYTLAQIDDVDTDVSASDAKNDITAYITLVELDGSSAVGNSTYNDTDINGYVASTYKEDAFLAVALNGANKIVDSYVANSVKGTVTAYKSTAVTIGGTKYDISAAKDSNSVSSFNFDDTNYVAYLTKEGYVLGIDGTDAVKLDDVYYINGVYFTKAANGSATYYAQVVSMEGVVSEMQLEKYAFETTLSGGSTPDSFVAKGGLYSFSDKDTNSTNNTKANNGKYSVTAYTTGDYEVNTGNNLSANVTSSSNSITLDGGTTTKFYINNNTKFILVDWDAASANADISVTTYTGATRVASGKSVAVIGSESGSSYVANIVVVAGQNLTSGVTNTNDVVYLSGAASTEVKDGYEATVYFMDGTNKTVTISASDNSGKGNEGFYTYAINSDGVYELTTIANPVYGNPSSVSANFVYDDESGYIPDTTINSIYNSQLITFTKITGINTSYNATFSDVKLSSNLQVVDARTSTNRDQSAYSNKIDTLAKLEAAMKKGAVTATAYVDDGEVLLIAVTSMPDARSTDTTVASATAVKGAGASAGLNVTATAVVDNSGHTIKVTASGATEGDTIVVTATPTHSAASASGSVTLTYSSSAWNTQTITITAENASTQAYTVSVQ